MLHGVFLVGVLAVVALAAPLRRRGDPDDRRATLYQFS